MANKNQPTQRIGNWQGKTSEHTAHTTQASRTNQQIVCYFPISLVLKPRIENEEQQEDEDRGKKLQEFSLDRNHQCPDNDTAIIFPVFVFGSNCVRHGRVRDLRGVRCFKLKICINELKNAQFYIWIEDMTNGLRSTLDYYTQKVTCDLDIKPVTILPCRYTRPQQSLQESTYKLASTIYHPPAYTSALRWRCLRGHLRFSAKIRICWCCRFLLICNIFCMPSSPAEAQIKQAENRYTPEGRKKASEGKYLFSNSCVCARSSVAQPANNTHDFLSRMMAWPLLMGERFGLVRKGTRKEGNSIISQWGRWAAIKE